MEKRTWSTPAAVAEQFMANEYVNACWNVACLVGQNDDPLTGSENDDPWGSPSWGTDYKHQTSSGNCGHIRAQYIIDKGYGTYAIKEKHEYRDMWGRPQTEWLEADIYLDGQFDYAGGTAPSADSSAWSDRITLDDNYSGYIFWKTTLNDQSYYHYGLVNLTDANRTTRHS